MRQKGRLIRTALSRAGLSQQRHARGPQAGRSRGGSPGRAEVSDEAVRKTSGGHADRSHFTVEFGRDESGPEDLRLTLPYAGLHIARQEDMKNVVSQEGHEQKTFDSAWIMLEDVIGVPFVGQLVEAIILDIPSLVS